MADPHSHAPIPDDPLRFQEAIDDFLKRVPMTKDAYDELSEVEKDFAFTVANVAQADLVAQVYDGIQSAIEDGETFETFQARIGDALDESWGGADPSRLEMIFETNVMDAYNGGRYAQQTAPATIAARPYGRYEGIDDGHGCEICEPCYNVILPLSHRFFKTHYPILHPRCRDIVTTLSKDEAEAEGITGEPPDGPPPVEGFGAPPASAGSDWEPDTSDYPAEIGDELDDKLGEDAASG